MGFLPDEEYAKAESSEAVSLENYNINVPDLIKLFDCLVQNENLRSLNLSNSTLGGFGIKIVCEFLKKNSTIEKIILNNCQISVHDLALFIESISNHHSLKVISLEDNSFDEKAIMLLQAFQQNQPNMHLHYSSTPMPRNPEDIYASPFEDGSALKSKYK
jgi:predicted esterase YcpF (UPF0227 family)